MAKDAPGLRPVVVVAVSLVVVLGGAVLTLFGWSTYGDILRNREQARRATCFSNVKSIGLAVQLYAQDYGGALPPGGPRADVLVPHYLPSADEYTCPTRAVTLAQNPGWGSYAPVLPCLHPGKSCTQSAGSPAACHCPCFPCQRADHGLPPLAGAPIAVRNLRDLAQPQLYPLVWCAGMAPHEGGDAAFEAAWWEGSVTGGTVVGYADGHTRYVRATRADFEAGCRAAAPPVGNHTNRR